MIEKTTASTEILSCETCLTEIPSSTSPNPEFDTYVSNYCGLECYAQWRENQTDEDKLKTKIT